MTFWLFQMSGAWLFLAPADSVDERKIVTGVAERDSKAATRIFGKMPL